MPLDQKECPCPCLSLSVSVARSGQDTVSFEYDADGRLLHLATTAAGEYDGKFLIGDGANDAANPNDARKELRK